MSAFNLCAYTRRVKDHRLDQRTMLSQLKHLIADLFRPDILESDKIAGNDPLMSGDLDSLDALELAICIEEKFGIEVCKREESRHAFASIAILAGFIHARKKENHARPHRLAAARIVRPVLTSPSPA
jgi:acyl carrier protein